MEDIKKISTIICFGVPILILFLIFIVLLACNSSAGDSSIVVVTNGFSTPFEADTNYVITSEFGTRKDPIDNTKTAFHSGMDLASSCGTNIIATADGIVEKVGHSETGLGNYVYIKHNSDIGIVYSAYGHMLDDSIIVEENQPITKGQIIGQVGSTGKSTGCHLHFMLMKGRISFEKKYLINPNFIIRGLL